MPYHVRISHRQDPHAEVILDLGRDELEERVLTPYRDGCPITTGGRTFPLSEIERIRVNHTDEDSKTLIPKIQAQRRAEAQRSGVVSIGAHGYDWYAAASGEDVTDRLITGPPGSGSAVAQDEAPSAADADDSRRVLVVHGRNRAAR